MELVLEASGHDQEALQALLREHGYAVSLRSDDPPAAEQHAHCICGNSPLGIFRSSLDGQLLSINEAGTRILKYDSPQEMIETVNRRGIAETLYLDIRRRREILTEVLRSDDWHVCEVRFRCKDGSVIDGNFRIRAVRAADDRPVELEGFFEDISERKKTERALQFTQFTVDKTGDQAFWLNSEGRFFYVNEAACASLGYSREELEGMAVWNINPTVSPESFVDHWRLVKENGSLRFETLHRAKDGRVFPVEIRANYVNVDGREYSCAFATDISERRQVEQQSRQASLVLENSPAVVFRWGASDDWPVEMVSRNVMQFGYTPDELLSGAIPYAALVHPEDLDQVVAELHVQIDHGEDTFNQEYRILTKQGEVRWVDERTLIERNVVGKVIAYQGIVLDITERKAAEEALRESEQRYREVFEHTSDCIFLLDVTADGRFKFAGFNPAEEKAVGLLSADTDGKFVEEILPRELADQVLANYRRCVEAGTTINYEEQLNLPMGNRFFQTVLIPVRNASGDIPRIIGIASDTTESRQFEKALRQANRVLENSPAVLFRWKAQHGWPVEMVTRNVNCFGYSPEELLSGAVPFAELVHPEDLDRVTAELVGHTIGGNDRFQQEYRIVTREGEVRWVDDRTVLERDAAGRVTHYQGIVIDITDRKRTELVMAVRLRLLQFSATHTLDELLEATLDEVEKLTDSQIGFYHFLEADQKTLSLQNWSTRTKREFCMAQEKGVHYPVSQAGVWVDCIHQRRPIIHNDYASLPHRKGLPPGHAPVIRELVVPVFRGENIVAVLGVGNKPQDYTSQDMDMVSLLADLSWEIAERKQAEEALRRSERKYRSIVEHAPFGITRSSNDGKLLSANPALASILKYDSAQELMETVNHSSIQNVLFLKPSTRTPLVENILTSDSWTIFNNRLRCKDGSLVTCRVHSRRIPDKDGQASAFESYQENITDQLEAEQALRESEEKFRVLAETSPVAICLYQGEYVTYANPAMERLFGYSAEELYREKYWVWVHGDYQEQVRSRALARLAGENVPSQYEAKFLNKSGEELYVMISAGAMEYQGRSTGVASFLDITERKQTEGLIRASLEEKEVLLREIHHRVKNNLQVISSLLYLQSHKFKDAEVQNCFLESQSRICSMALAHEQLYQSKNLAEISVKSYVESLVRQLQQIFLSPGQEIDCRLVVEDIPLDIEKVVPCGLLITELLSNAYKHAFVDGRSGKIIISLQSRAGQIELVVADDGVGLPLELDYRQAKTLGLQLVRALVNQLGGSLELGGGHGTCFRISFAG